MSPKSEQPSKSFIASQTYSAHLYTKELLLTVTQAFSEFGKFEIAEEGEVLRVSVTGEQWSNKMWFEFNNYLVAFLVQTVNS